MNRRIAKFPWNQQTVDSSRMSSPMTEKNIACTDTIRLNRLGDCPVNAVKEMQNNNNNNNKTKTIYFINPSGKLKLSFDRTTKNIIILNHEPHAQTHTLRHTPPFSQSAYTNT